MTMLPLPVAAAAFVLVLATTLTVSMLDRGDPIDRAASPLMAGTVLTCLIIGPSIASIAGGGTRISGLPASGLLGFLGAVGGICVVTLIWRDKKKK
jgi:hypothetical protein